MLQGIIGTAILIAVGLDSFITVFTTRGGGWGTNFWTGHVWRTLLWVHARRRIHRVLAIAGPALLFSIVLLWYFLMVAGWTLIFAGWDSSVINASDKAVAQWHQKLAFVGVTLSTLGYGNHIPNGLPWTVLANLTALSGTILLTYSLSYFLAVLSAALERRQLASQIYTVGSSVAAFVERAWAGKYRGQLDTKLLDIAAQVNQHAHKHVSFPVLRFFHSDDWRHSPSRAVLLFSDAIFLASHGISPEDRPPMPVLHVCERSIAVYLEQAGAGLASEASAAFDEEDDEVDPPDHISRGLLKELGLNAVEPAELRQAWIEYRPRRSELVALCKEDGWEDIRHQDMRRPAS